MSAKGKIVIQDTCILLDLVDLNLLGAFFQLNLIVFTTPQVTGEITDDAQWREVSCYIANGRLQIDSDGDFQAMLSIKSENPGLSFADSSVLELAIRKMATVLSSDGSLRKSCDKAGIDVHGVLWIIECLCQAEIITPAAGCDRLREYERINSRVPKEEVQLLINKLSR